MSTVGIHPKVLLALIVGTVGAVTFYVFGDHATAKTVLLSTIGLAGVGYSAPPGEITPPFEPPAPAPIQVPSVQVPAQNPPPPQISDQPPQPGEQGL